MAHLAQYNNGSSGGASYYEQQTQQQTLPPHMQPQQQQRSMVAAPSSHYALGPYQQVNMQQQSLSHKQPSPIPSPYRQVQQPMQGQQQLNTQIHAPPHHSPHTQQMHMQQQQQPPHMLHQHPTRPISSGASSFKRELFPHEMAQQQQQQHQQQQPPHRQSSFAALAGVPGSKDGANISPPPGSDEFYFHEANVRSLTESPSPPLPLQQQQQSLQQSQHPPEQVAHMLSQIIKKQQADLRGQPMPQQQQQQHSSQHQQMLAQQAAAQQQAQRAELYNHFQSAGYKPAGLPPHQQQQQQQQNHYASPAASLQLSQSQAHSAHSQLASHYNSRTQSSDSMRPPQQQQSYYDQAPPQSQQHGPYSTHMHQQQPQSQGPQGYSSLQKPSGPGLSAAQQSQQHSPSQIPGMSNVVDPEYIRMLKRRQAELIEMQQQEQIRAAQMRLQQQQQQQQPMQHGSGMQMRLDSQLDHHSQHHQHSQQAFAPVPSLSAPLHDPYAAQAPPPLQGRSQSLPAADQYGQIVHSSSNVPTAHGYYTEQSLQQSQQPQYRSDGYLQQQQQQPPGGMPLQHGYSSNGSVLPPHLQQQQPLHMHSQQQQLPYASSGGGSVPPPGIGLVGVAAPPGFKPEGSPSGNSPPQQGRLQQYQSQPQQGQQQPSRYEQMQQLKQIVGNVNAEADFRGGAASPNFGPNSATTAVNSNVNSVHYPPPSAGGSTGRVPTAPYPRRSQSLGDPNSNMGMGVGAPPPPVSHEAVPISLGGRRGAAAGSGEGAEGATGERGRVVAAANLSRFSAGPPNQDSRGFVARCCTEARRGGRGGNHLSPSAANSVSSSAAPAGSAGSSVLTRASFGTRRTSKDYTQLGASSYVPLNQYNPFSNLSSSPDLDSSPSPSNANGGDRERPSAATWAPRDGSGNGGTSKPAPLSMSSSSASGGGSNSGQTTPSCQSPSTKQHPAPRARMHTPLLPPTPK